MGLTDLAGSAAVASSLLFVWPQVVRLVRTRDPEGISVVGALWAMSGFTLWSAYGLDRDVVPIVVANAQALVGFAIVLTLRIRLGDPTATPGPTAVVPVLAIVLTAALASAPVVGIAAICVGATSFLPQARVAWRGVGVGGVSAATYCLLTISASLWILFGLLKRDPLVVAPNLVIVPTATLIALRALRSQPRSAAEHTTSAS